MQNKNEGSLIKKLLSLLLALLPHLLIVLMGMLLTLVIIDSLNSAMNFINNSMTKGLLFVACLLAFLVSGMLIAKQRK